MLPFGSITSLVPLSILAFAYLVYISAAILNKNIPESSKTPGETEILVSADPDIQVPVTYPDYRFSDNGSDDIVAFDERFHFRDYACIFFHEIHYDESTAPASVSPFSPRPPPAL